MTLKTFRKAISSGLAIGAVMMFSAGIVSAGTVSTKVTGLPSGLRVTFASKFFRCTATGPRFDSGPNVDLTEQSHTTYEPYTLPGGQPSIRAMVVVEYVGSMSVNPPANNGCQGVDPRFVNFGHHIWGEENGSPTTRVTDTLAFVNGDIAVNRHLEAKTLTIRENFQTLQSPAPLTKSVLHRWSVNYSDPFMSTSVVVPSLDFTQLTNINGFLVTTSKAKMWITEENEICLRVGGNTVCRARSQGGSISTGGVTVNVGDTTVGENGSPDNGKNVMWSFRLDSSFATGRFTAVALANDKDIDAYLVDGQNEPLNLLPWISLKLTVDVVN